MKLKVSVLMPVYNGEKYLREAVDSILGQTFTDFEFIIIDDGSKDQSASIIKSYHDPRIRFMRNDLNLGLIATLNRGLDAASGEYIARMDQDDISLAERLAKQVAFMDSQPEIAASGTWAQGIDEEGNMVSLRRMPFGKRMDYDFWRPSPLIHSSAIIRKALLKNLRYNSDALHCEDYDLWLSLRKKYKIDNLPEDLLLYRVHSESITRVNLADQLRSVHEIFYRQTGFAVSFELFLELIGFSSELNPVRRALLMRRLAGALQKPYRRYLREDIEYAKDWLRRRKRQFMWSLYCAYRRIRYRTTNDSLNGGDSSHLS